LFWLDTLPKLELVGSRLGLLSKTLSTILRGTAAPAPRAARYPRRNGTSTLPPDGGIGPEIDILGKTHTERWVLDGPAQVDEIHVVDPTRAVIVGQAQSAVGEVIVLGPRSARVIDRFLGLHPVISPDRTRIAYVKVYPVHFTEGVSAQYLVYDRTKPPSAFRHPTVAAPRDPAATQLSERVNVGVPVYPRDAENVPHE
jgi:hypothetical protein